MGLTPHNGPVVLYAIRLRVRRLRSRAHRSSPDGYAAAPRRRKFRIVRFPVATEKLIHSTATPFQLEPAKLDFKLISYLCCGDFLILPSAVRGPAARGGRRSPGWRDSAPLPCLFIFFLSARWTVWSDTYIQSSCFWKSAQTDSILSDDPSPLQRTDNIFRQ